MCSFSTDEVKLKVAMYYSLDDIRIQDMPKPKIGSGEILVEMKACGVCGSDLMDWYLRSRAPLVLGHEPAGIIVEAGKNVEGFKVGDRVFAHHHVACLTCHFCINGDYTMCPQFGQTHIEPGGFAEYFRVPAPNLQIDTLKLPSNVSYEEATLIEPVGCCIRAQSKCNIQTGDIVAVIGAGPLGIIHVMLAQLSGAAKTIVSDMVEYRLKAAKQFGADLTINPQNEKLTEKVKKATEGRGADVVIVTAPNVKALENGIQICRKGGTLCLFAPTQPEEQIRLSPHRLFFSEIKIVPSYSTSHIETRLALQLISSGKIKAKELITHRFPLSQIAEAFETAAKNKECLKVIVLNKE
jgi:L-iditol 2-dehydrogenase